MVVPGDGLGWTQPIEGYQAIVRHGYGPAPGGNEFPTPPPAAPTRLP
ncbi:hypothetical protein ACWF9G_27170 [Nocardia sp. NPDC055029]